MSKEEGRALNEHIWKIVKTLASMFEEFPEWTDFEKMPHFALGLKRDLITIDPIRNVDDRAFTKIVYSESIALREEAEDHWKKYVVSYLPDCISEVTVSVDLIGSTMGRGENRFHTLNGLGINGIAGSSRELPLQDIRVFDQKVDTQKQWDEWIVLDRTGDLQGLVQAASLEHAVGSVVASNNLTNDMLRFAKSGVVPEAIQGFRVLRDPGSIGPCVDLDAGAKRERREVIVEEDDTPNP